MNISLTTKDEKRKFLNDLNSNENTLVNYLKELNAAIISLPDKITHVLSLIHELKRAESFSWEGFIKNVYEILFFIMKSMEENYQLSNFSILEKFAINILIISDEAYEKKNIDTFYDSKENLLMESILKKLNQINSFPLKIAITNMSLLSGKNEMREKLEEEVLSFFINKINAQIEKINSTETNLFIHEFIKKNLEAISKHFRKDNYRALKGIKKGMMKKEKLKYLWHSIIISDNMNFYVLLESLSKTEFSSFINSNVFPPEIISDLNKKKTGDLIELTFKKNIICLPLFDFNEEEPGKLFIVENIDKKDFFSMLKNDSRFVFKNKRKHEVYAFFQLKKNIISQTEQNDENITILNDEDYEDFSQIKDLLIKNKKNINPYLIFLNRAYGLEPCIYKIRLLIDLLYDLSIHKLCSWDKFVNVLNLIFYHIQGWKSFKDSEFLIDKFVCHCLKIVDNCYALKMKGINYEVKKNLILENFLNDITKMNLNNSLLEFGNLRLIRKKEKSITQYDERNYQFLKNRLEIERGKLLDKSFSLQLKYIEQLLKHFVKDKYRIIKCIRLGKFSQKKLNYLSHSIIVGEDDGMYLLLKTVSKKELSYIKEKYQISSEYIKEKIVIQGKRMKISIGKGSFGKIEISLCLLENRKKNIFPGQLLCVKKTNHEDCMTSNGEILSFSDIRNSTWNDYLSITIFSFSPEIYDMRIINHATNKKLKKGYCFQRFLPVNNGISFRKNEKFKKWKHQKKYFLDILEAIISFHEKGICMTDLKPENTLYDLLTRRGTLIDLAGVVKRKNKEELKACKSKFIKEYTLQYTAPEMILILNQENEDAEIDLPQAISFSIGKMIKRLIIDVMNANNSEKNEIFNQILILSTNMTKPSPIERWTLEDSFKFLQEIPIFEEKNLFNVSVSLYIESLNKKFEKGRFIKFGMKRKLNKILRGFYKDIEVSSVDQEQSYSEKDNKLNALDVLREFLKSESFPGEKELFLLMGASGSGISTILQYLFVNFVNNWKISDPLPIFMNLGEEMNIYLQWKKIKKLLKIDLNFHRIKRESKYPIILFLDCLDDSKRSLKLIESIIDDLDGSKRNIKIVLTCKSGYIDPNKELNNLKFNKCDFKYLLPFSDDYLDNNENIKELIISYYKKIQEEIINEEFVCDLVEKIEIFELKKMMKTPFLIDLVLKALPNLKNNINIDLLCLFEEHFKDRFQNQSNEEIRSNYKFAIELAESMMKTIHIANRLDKNDSSDLINIYFNNVYNSTLPFFDQTPIIKIMKALDINIIVNNNPPNEEFSFSFPHDLIRKFLLVRGFLAKSEKKEFPKWISHVSIVDDRDLIYLLVLAIEKNIKLIDFCRVAILKNDKENYLSFLASNLITILVAANVSFYNENLSNINIKRANLTDGIFTNCDFTNSDLTNAIINNCKFEKATFKNTNLKDVELDIYPKIKVGFIIYKIALSSKEDKIFVCGESETIKIFNLEDQKIEELIGHQNIVKTLVAARYSDILISGGCDKLIKIWEFNFRKEILTLSGHKSEITCLALSSNEKNLLSGSKDKSLRVWDIENGIEIFKIATISNYIPSIFYHKIEQEIIFVDYKNIVLFNLQNATRKNILHEEIILALAYDNVNDRLASAVHKSILLWNIKNMNYFCFLKELKGHENAINTLTFSTNLKFLISSGNDKKILIWDIQSGLILNKLIGHTNVITSLHLSKNDEMIFSGGFDNYLRIFSLNKKRKIKKYEGHNAELTFLALSKNNLYFASSSLDQTIGIWEVQNGKEIKQIKVKDMIVRVLCFLSPNMHLVTGDDRGIISVWNIENGERLKEIDAHEDFINSLIISKDEHFLASGSSDNFVKIWLVQNDFEYLFQLNHEAIVITISFSKNDSMLISAGEGEYIKIWDLADKTIINELPSDYSTFNAISLSPDYLTLAAGDSDGQIKIWNLKNPNLLSEPKILLKYQEKQIYSLLFIDNSTLISGGGDGMIYVWDLNTFSKIAEFIGHKSTIKSLVFCEEYNTIISGSEDKEIRIWDYQNEGKMEIEQLFPRIIIGSDATEFKGSKFIEEGKELEKRIANIFSDNQ